MNDAKEFNFSGIDRAEYGSLFQFLASKKLNVKNPEQVRILVFGYSSFSSALPCNTLY